jgi:uncharacterized protein affecting Mg2+/Co2+ transport
MISPSKRIVRKELSENQILLRHPFHFPLVTIMMKIAANIIFAIFATAFIYSHASAETRVSPAVHAVSNTYTGGNYTASNAIDGNANTSWNAGGGPVQWIALNLGSPKRVTRLSLTVDQYPAGNTVHNIQKSDDGSTWTGVTQISGYTSAQQVLNVVVDFSARHIRIETTQSPSWVGWAEIEVFETPATPVAAAYQCTFVGQNIPATMTAGQTYAVSVTMRNDGSDTWSAATNYNLGSQNVQDNTVWGLGRVATPGAIGPGQQATFSFNVTAPSAPGTYNFQWRMVRDGVTWFGALTTNVAVTVVATPPPTPSGANLIANGGFESPYTADYFYPVWYGTVIPGWSWEGGVAIQRNGSAWDAATAPEGQQTVVLQNNATLSTTLNLGAGQYMLEFKSAARRYGGQQTISVQLNGINTGYVVTPTSPVFNQYQTTLTVATGNNVIALVGTNVTGDNSAFIDDVRLTASSGSGTTRKDYSYFFVGGAVNQNYSSSISDHTSLAWVFVDPSDINSLNQLKSFLSSLPTSVKIVLAGPIFFGLPVAGQPPQFLSDYQSRWNTLVSETGLTAAQYERIAAIYLVDEPELSPLITDGHFATARSLVQSVRPSGSSHTPALSTIYSYLVSSNNPTKSPVGIASVDWLGFNCYPVSSGGTWDNCAGTSQEQHLANLKSKRVSPATQKILLVAETSISRLYPNDPIDSARRAQAIANLRLMRSIALAESSVAGVVAFNLEGLASGANGFGWAGANALNDVFVASRSLGRCMINVGTCSY